MNCPFKQNKAALLGNILFIDFFFFLKGTIEEQSKSLLLSGHREGTLA